MSEGLAAVGARVGAFFGRGAVFFNWFCYYIFFFFVVVVVDDVAVRGKIEKEKREEQSRKEKIIEEKRERENRKEEREREKRKMRIIISLVTFVIPLVNIKYMVQVHRTLNEREHNIARNA